MAARATSKALTRYSCRAGSVVTTNQAAIAANRTAIRRAQSTDVVSQAHDGRSSGIDAISLTAALRTRQSR